MARKNIAAKSGIYVYLGPSIRGVIQNGTIYRGTRRQVLSAIAIVIEKYPKIERLIVEDSEIVSSKAKIKMGGNALSNAYKAILAAEK